MTYTSPQHRLMTEPPAPDTDNGPAPHEIKYRQDAAHYVSSMLTELRQIAGKAGFDRLVTALDAAYYEAYGALGAQSKAPSAANGEKNEKVAETMEPSRQS